MKKEFIFSLVVINLLLGLFIVAPLVAAERHAPGSSWHGFPISEMGDYFHYIYMVRSGSQGQILFHNAYSEESFPLFLNQPFYNLLGLATAPLKVSPYLVYFVSRLISVELLFIAVIYLATWVFGSGNIYVVLAGLIFVTNTSFYSTSGDPETYSWMFNIFRKFTMLPVHYHVAWSVLILLVIRFSRLLKDRRDYLVTGILGLLLALIHPYIAMTYTYIVWGFGVVRFMMTKTSDKNLWGQILAYSAGAVPVMIYHGWVFATIWKASSATATVFQHEVPGIPFINYLLALGPAAILAVTGLIGQIREIRPIYILLLLWAFLPPLLFYAPLPIPVPYVRLFQIYQHIPLALLAAFAIKKLVNKIPKWRSLVVGLVAGGFLAYGIPAYMQQFSLKTHLSQSFFSYYKILTAGEGVFAYLNKFAGLDSVVLADEKLSSILPTMTNTRVILGHDGDQRNFYEKRGEVRQFFAGEIAHQRIREFLDKYHIGFMIFGLDPVTSLPGVYADLPYWQEVYSEPFLDREIVVYKIK